jgi:hypothetical protein
MVVVVVVMVMIVLGRHGPSYHSALPLASTCDIPARTGRARAARPA